MLRGVFAAALALGLSALPLAATASARSGVQAEPEAAPESELDRLLRLSREASPVVRPQAARRLLSHGAAAAERVRAITGGTPAGYASLGQDLMEVLGELDDAELRGDLWEALDDADFPWRPSAARTLAGTARPAEKGRLRAALKDPLAYVRAAAVTGLLNLDARDARLDVRALLADPSDRVRREAATAIDAWGDPSALWWLVEELRREDRFFDLSTGKQARFEAARRLARRLEGGHGFVPERSPRNADNQEALERIVAKVTELAGPAPKLPDVARAGGADIQGVLGLEVRSCRRGEVFLRWDTDGTVWVGTGNAQPFLLVARADASLMERAEKALAVLGERDFWGEPGCDVEIYYLPGPDGLRAVSVAKGPAAIEGLRPEPLNALARSFLATLPPDLADLRAGVEEKLAAVGGALPRD